MNGKALRSLTSAITAQDHFRPKASAVASRDRCLAVGSGLKRPLDVLVAIVAIVLLSPLLLCVSVMVWITSPGPIFYGHERVGLDGRVFRCWKFRSMMVNADRALAQHLASSPAARKEWAETRKLRDDPRITAIGHTLRATSIDELPQLLNVLMGEMSLVGPRPVTKGELVRYGRSARHYLSARPGITGLWQVSGRSETHYGRRVALDRKYAQNPTLLMDIWILLRTVPVVLNRQGSW